MTLRNRKYCPSCGALSIRYRVKLQDYRCVRCNWIGKHPVTKLGDSFHITSTDKKDWMRQLHDIHTKNPQYNKKELSMISMLGSGAVDRYWTLYVIGKQYIIKPII